MKRLLILSVMFLSSCTSMTDDEIRAAKAACIAKGGTPVQMVNLQGMVKEVRCW